ncbi:MAG: diguanylate cyclase domain-containing protein [Acidimicrobiales bacterium]
MSAIGVHDGERQSRWPPQVGADFVAQVAGDTVLTCSGELDPTTAPRLRYALDRVLMVPARRVVVDLDGVTFLDASTIGELVRACEVSRTTGGRLVLRSPTPLGRRVLEHVGLGHLIETRPRQRPVQGEPAPWDAAAELAAAWESACATDRYGAAPLLFEPSTMLPAIAALLDGAEAVGDDTTGAAVPPSGGGPVSAAALLQLWALNDVAHTWIESHDDIGPDRERRHRQRSMVEAVLAGMASLMLDELEQATLLDPLTGLLNRRALDRDLVRTVADVRRHGYCLSVVVVDVVDLKGTNDRFGHASGDVVLRAVAADLASVLRPGDRAYRVGGDEFVLVLPESCADDIDAILDRVEVGVHGAFTWGCASIARVDDGSSDAECVARLLALADTRMLDFRARSRVHRTGGRLDAVQDVARHDDAVSQRRLALAGELAATMRDREVVDEAKGVIAGHFGIGIDEATVALLRFSATHPQTLAATAAGIVDRTIDVARLVSDRAQDESVAAPGVHDPVPPVAAGAVDD